MQLLSVHSKSITKKRGTNWFQTVPFQPWKNELRYHFCLSRFCMHTQKTPCSSCITKIIKKIAEYKYLEHIDLSFNSLNTLKHLTGLKFLTSIKATNNQLTSVLDTKEPPLHLDLLDLSCNRISSIPDLSRHKSLRVLKLNSNKITSINGIDKNKFLRILDVS